MTSRWFNQMAEAATPDEFPLLARTRRDLTPLLADSLLPLRKLALALMGDPAMALRVLQQANVVPHRHFRADVVTLEDAAHMLGTQTLLRLESEAPVDERVLNAERLAPYRRSAGRAVLAALFAYDWAEIDHDRFPSEVSLAALLNNLGELFLLAHGDARISRYLDLVEEQHVLPHEAEYVSLGESLEDLGHALAVRWGLPEMVREAMRARNARHPRALCVMLATQIARYAFSAWRHPMQMDDLHLAGIVLELELSDLAQRINRVLDHFNRTAADYGLAPLKSLPIDDTGRPAVLPSTRQVVFGLAPRQDDFTAAMTALSKGEPVDRESVFATLLRGLHRGLGLNRVVFAAYRAREETLTAEYLVGTDFEPSFNRFSLSRVEGGFFAELLDAPSAVWLNDDNEATLAPRMPAPLLDLIGVTRFFAMSLWVGGRVIGLVYADRRTASCHLDARSYQSFRELVSQAARCLERLAG